MSIWYYDYWRRRAIEEVLYADEKRRYHSNILSTHLTHIIVQLKAMNRVRVGDEHDVQNLVEYLTNQTVRE